ncbi:MAG: hypothetical protein ACLQRH_23715 [Acidimicrobiales bacterium]
MRLPGHVRAQVGPLGIVPGRFPWVPCAHELSVVPAPGAPVMTMASIVVGIVVFGNVVAAFPARTAARTQTALLQRAE